MSQANKSPFTMRQLMEAGVHFGHHTRRWNPKMGKFIFGARDNIHIINLDKTYPLLNKALDKVREVAAKGGRVLFVGTKRQASDIVAEYAQACGQYYVNYRWLGGTMTNWQTVMNSIKTLKAIDERMAQEEELGLTKKEMLNLSRQRNKLEAAIGGIKDMGGVPDLVFVVDTIKESIAIAEANKLKIPVVGILDTNSDPAGVDYPVPGNDDAMKAIRLYCSLVSEAVLDGIRQELSAKGVSAEAQQAQSDTAAEEKQASEKKDEAVEAEEKPVAKKAPAKKAATKKADEKAEGDEEKPKAKKAPAKKPAAKKPAAKKSTAKKADKAEEAA